MPSVSALRQELRRRNASKDNRGVSCGRRFGMRLRLLVADDHQLMLAAV